MPYLKPTYYAGTLSGFGTGAGAGVSFGAGRSMGAGSSHCLIGLPICVIYPPYTSVVTDGLSKTIDAPYHVGCRYASFT